MVTLSHKKMKPRQFHRLVLNWYDQHGRHDLPWQHNKTPFRVWVSEIMLQQTQVSTVIPFYQRFMKTFPTVKALAAAKEDAVLHLWTGLGYYSRARNLLHSAQIIQTDYAGKFPANVDDLQSLPGIGPSTAGAIAAIAFNQKATILDGNVKRVLTRFHGITAWAGEKTTADTLWELATHYTPTERIADYTQAIMDLGATVCTRSKPNCSHCPLQTACQAYHLDLTTSIPAARPKKTIPVRQTHFLLITHGNAVYLTKRARTGIWGGLWSFPEVADLPSPAMLKRYCREQFQLEITRARQGTPFRHTFSHFHLDILPIAILCKKIPRQKLASKTQIWYNIKKSPAIGLPAPVKKLLETLT